MKQIVRAIPNKKEHMNAIRKMVISMLQQEPTPIKNQSKDEYYMELLHTYPAWFHIPLSKGKSSFQNPYGHTSICLYQVKNNKIVSDVTINVGTLLRNNVFDRSKFLHFIPTEKYLFNNFEENANVDGNQQGGLLQRSFLGINIRLTPEKWLDTLKYFENLRQDVLDNKFKFSLGMHIVTNFFPLFIFRERGNCSYWISKGLEYANLIDNRTSFPMICFYKFLLNILLEKNKYFKENKPKACIVFYEGIYHNMYPKGTYMYPFYWIKYNYKKIWNKEELANIKVNLEQYNDICTVKTTKLDESKSSVHLNKYITYIKDMIGK